MSDDLFADLNPQTQNDSPWQKTRLLGENEVTFVVEPEAEAPSKEGLQTVARFWTELPSFDAKARTFLHENTLDNDSATREYLEHHLDGLRFDVLAELFGDTDDLEVGTFIDALVLVRVALCPSLCSAVFDYSLGVEITNYVLAVSVSADGANWSVSVES